MKNKLGNPAAIVATAASNPELVKAGKETVKYVRDESIKTAKILLITGATIITGYYLNKAYKKWRIQNFVEKNAHLSDVQAAMIFRKAMYNIEPFDFLFLEIDINIFTDTSTLNSLALKVSSFENVVKAYKIIFDGNLVMDVYSKLNNSKLQQFYDRLNAKSEFDSGFGANGQLLPQVPYRPGQTLMVQNPNGASVYKAELVNGVYKRGEIIGSKKYGETIGTVHKIYKSPSSPQHFYVVDRHLVIDTIFGYGWVNHTDVKIKT